MLGTYKTCKKLIPQKQNKNFSSLQKTLIIFDDLSKLHCMGGGLSTCQGQIISWEKFLDSCFCFVMVIAFLKLSIILKIVFSIYKNKTQAHTCKMKTI